MSRKSASKFTSPTSTKKQKKPLKTLRLLPRDGPGGLEPPSKKSRPSFSLLNPPLLDLTREDTTVASGSQGQGYSGSRSARYALSGQCPSVDIKGKRKETGTPVEDGDDNLWVDMYGPRSEAELAVHKRKVEDVRRWLLEAFEGGPSGKLRKYRRILALTGPAGTAKTSTLHILSRELDFEILEWRNSMSESSPSTFASGESHPDGYSLLDSDTLFDKFQAFLTRATTCNSIFGRHSMSQKPRSCLLVPPQSSAQSASKRHLILLEDLPNLLHQPTLTRFQAALQSLCNTSDLSEPPRPPIVIILSDSGLRAEQPDDNAWDGSNSRRRWEKMEVLDIRNVLGPELLTGPYVTTIGFNPIAPTLMTKALQALLARHFGSLDAHDRAEKQPPREVIDIIVESSNGDIRSAIMALQFACIVDFPASSTKSKGKVTRKNPSGMRATTNVRAVLEAVTRREQSLVLFHLMGKILYNKRKFDPPASHLSAKGVAMEHELDMQLVDPLPLPGWLSHHDRKASRVCLETLMADSPIDSSLLGMYIHQNYTLFCTDVDQCDGVCEGLSLVDSMSGALMGNSPYVFPTLTLSTLHALPTPVPRHGQKVCKPSWFDVRRQELEASDTVRDVLGWLGRDEAVGSDVDKASSVSAGKWTHATVAMELGGWLRALDRGRGQGSSAPRMHHLFSCLPWRIGGEAVGEALGEHEDGDEEDEDVTQPRGVRGREEGRGWLEEDDIEDVE